MNSKRFQLIKEIGSGLTSKVFQAHDTVTDNRVALKVLNPVDPDLKTQNNDSK